MKKPPLSMAWKYVVLCIIALIVLFPIIWIIMQSLKNYFDTIAYPPKLLFKPTLSNYLEVVTTNDFLKAFLKQLQVPWTQV